MTRTAAFCACLLILAIVAASARAGGTVAKYGNQPQFSSSPRPLTAIQVPWRASRPLTRGLELWASGRRDLATKWFEQAVHELAGDPIAWHNLGVAYFCASRFEESYMCFQHERFLYMVAPSALYGMGMCQLALGHASLAENLFAMALHEAPREWEYWHRFGQALAASGKHEAAAVASRNAARLKPRIRLMPRGVKGINASILTLRFPLAPHS
ncbi:MAG: tetratricopeptide repeat protein [Candidatus Coatesbacteria bacterium]